MVNRGKAFRLMDPSPLAFTFVVIQKWSDRVLHNRWAPSTLSSSRSSKIRFRGTWGSCYFLLCLGLRIITIGHFCFWRNESSMSSWNLGFDSLGIKDQIWKLTVKIMACDSVSFNRGSRTGALYYLKSMILCHIIQLSLLMQLEFPLTIDIVSKSIHCCGSENICLISVCMSLYCSWWVSAKPEGYELASGDIYLTIFCEYSLFFSDEIALLWASMPRIFEHCATCSKEETRCKIGIHKFGYN